MDGLEKPKIFYKHRLKHLIYYSYTHKSCERKKIKERRQRSAQLQLSLPAPFLQKISWLQDIIPYGVSIHSARQVAREKNQLIELDEFTALPHQGPQSEPGVKASQALTCIDNSLVIHWQLERPRKEFDFLSAGAHMVIHLTKHRPTQTLERNPELQIKTESKPTALFNHI